MADAEPGWLEAQIAAVLGPSGSTDDLLRATLSSLWSVVLFTDLDGRILYANRIGESFDLSRVIGSRVFDWALPEFHARIANALAEVARTRRQAGYSIYATSLSGNMAFYDVSVGPIVHHDVHHGYVFVSRDVSAQRKDAEALRESEQMLRLSVDCSGMGLWRWEMPSGEMVWDRRTCEIYGLARAPRTFEEFLELVHPDDVGTLRAIASGAMATDERTTHTYRVLRPDGDMRWVEVTGQNVRDQHGNVVRVLGGVVDATSRHTLEEQLRVAQKLEAVGQLTAGIAHNFNNILMTILPTLEMAQRETVDPFRTLLREAHHAGIRAAEMVRQLMTFTRARPETTRKVEHVPSLVDRAVAMCREVFDRHVQIVVTDFTERGLASVHAGQIEHALLNVLLNARDALVEAGAEKPQIVVEIAEIGAHTLRLRISDNGVGMTDGVRSRVFEPFFTTKPVGKGTGLGLATTYGILRDHGGSVTCESTLGKGTTLTLELPAYDGDVEASGNASHDRRLHRGSETLLLTDDEAPVRQIVTRILEEAGYRVVTAASGDDAVARLQADSSIALVLLDLSMPGPSPHKTIERLRALSPATRIVLFTGQAVEEELLRAVDGLVTKPMATEALLATVRDALDREVTGAGA